MTGFKQRRGFSLLELLVVLGIMVLLAALSAPAAARLMRASSLNSAGREVIDQLNYGRQTAIAKSRPVEVRFYKLPDYTDEASADPDVYRGFQLFIHEPEEVLPLGKPIFFSAPVMILENQNESEFLFDDSNHPEKSPTDADDFELPLFEDSYRYRSFLYLPSGSTDLSEGKNFMTLVMQNDRPLSEGANFFTVQIDPISGSVRHFRP